MTKILIATGIYPPSIGGPATYSKTLFEELPKRGVGVAVLSFDEVRNLPRVLRHIVYFFKLAYRARGSDIIYAQDPVSVGLPAMLAAKMLKKRFYLKIVGDYAWEQFQAGQSRVQSGGFVPPDGFHEKRRDFLTELRKKIEQLTAREAEKIVVPSKYLKKIVTDWDIPGQKITVINNSFEPFPLPETAYRPKVKLHGKTVISAGRLVPWKGFSVMLEVTAELNKKFPDLKLIIIGDGPERAALERRITELGLGKNVFLTGKVPQETLFEYLRQGSVFVLNTGYEGFSHQLLEALSAGIPVVTTKIGGNPEIITDGVNGILVPYNDKRALSLAVEKMLLEDSFASGCVSSGKETAAKFTKEKMIDSLINLF